MGYELAPYNEMFAGAKTRDIDVVPDHDDQPEQSMAPDSPEALLDDSPTNLEFTAERAGIPNKPSEPAAEPVDDSEDIDHYSHSVASLSTAELFLDEALTSQDDKAAEVNEVVAEVMAGDAIDAEPTNLNPVIDENTANLNFIEDNPVLIDQVESDEEDDDRIDLSGVEDAIDELNLNDPEFAESTDDVDELVLDEEAFAESIGQAEDEETDDSLHLDEIAADTDELQFEKQSDTGTMDSIDTVDNAEPTDSMTFAMGDESPETDRKTLTAAQKMDTAEMRDARILHFPETGTGRHASAEFESETKMTLQALRDQLQDMTERLFRQEREASELRQLLQKLTEEQGTGSQDRNRESS